MDIKKQLQDLIKKKSDQNWRDSEAKTLLASIQEEQTKALKPILEGMAKTIGEKMLEHFKTAISAIKIDTPQNHINIPDIKVPDFPKFPDIKIPTPIVHLNPIFNVPEGKIKMPDIMKVFGALQLEGINNKNPLPVLLMDIKGKPFQLASLMGGGVPVTGGRGDFFTVVGITNSVAIVMVDAGGVAYSGSNPLPTSATISLPSGQGDSATATRIIQAGDSISSTNVTQIAATPIAVDQGVSGPGVQRIVHATDVGTSVNVIGFTASVATIPGNVAGTPYDSGFGLPVNIVSENVSLEIKQVSGFVDSVNLVNQDQNSGPVSPTTLRVVNVTDVGTSVSVTSITGPIGQGDTVSALRIVHAGDSAASVSAFGDTASGVTDAGNPVKIGGVARTANPTAVTNGQRVNFGADKLGRQLSRPVQVRDLIATARVNVITGTEATLLAAGGAGVFLDCISVMCANASTNAVTVDFRSVVGGNKEFSVQVPANATAGIVHPVPWPQANANNSWTVQLGDDTQNITINALFTQEI